MSTAFGVTFNFCLREVLTKWRLSRECSLWAWAAGWGSEPRCGCGATAVGGSGCDIAASAWLVSNTCQPATSSSPTKYNKSGQTPRVLPWNLQNLRVHFRNVSLCFYGAALFFVQHIAHLWYLPRSLEVQQTLRVSPGRPKCRDEWYWTPSTRRRRTRIQGTRPKWGSGSAGSNRFSVRWRKLAVSVPTHSPNTAGNQAKLPLQDILLTQAPLVLNTWHLRKNAWFSLRVFTSTLQLMLMRYLTTSMWFLKSAYLRGVLPLESGRSGFSPRSTNICKARTVCVRGMHRVFCLSRNVYVHFCMHCHKHQFPKVHRKPLRIRHSRLECPGSRAWLRSESRSFPARPLWWYHSRDESESSWCCGATRVRRPATESDPRCLAHPCLQMEGTDLRQFQVTRDTTIQHKQFALQNKRMLYRLRKRAAGGRSQRTRSVRPSAALCEFPHSTSSRHSLKSLRCVSCGL